MGKSHRWIGCKDWCVTFSGCEVRRNRISLNIKNKKIYIVDNIVLTWQSWFLLEGKGCKRLYQHYNDIWKCERLNLVIINGLHRNMFIPFRQESHLLNILCFEYKPLFIFTMEVSKLGLYDKMDEIHSELLTFTEINHKGFTCCMWVLFHYYCCCCYTLLWSPAKK